MHNPQAERPNNFRPFLPQRKLNRLFIIYAYLVSSMYIYICIYHPYIAYYIYISYVYHIYILSIIHIYIYIYIQSYLSIDTYIYNTHTYAIILFSQVSIQNPQDSFQVIIKIYSPTRTQPTWSATGAWHRERRTSNTRVVGGFAQGNGEDHPSGCKWLGSCPFTSHFHGHLEGEQPYP